MNKKAMFAALSAGAIAGTGAGLILGVPGLTSAAIDTTDSSTDMLSASAIDIDADGTDADHGGHKGRRGKMASPETLAEVLGIDVETLRAEFAAGKSIADIASEQGIEIETVVDALVAEVETHLDEHVADGSLSEDEAADKLAKAEAMISERVNEVPQMGGRGHGFRRGAQLSTTVVDMLGVDAATLRAAFAAGQTVADVASENGVDVNDIVSALVDERATHLAEHVADGSLTQEEADEKLADAEAMITERLNTVPPAGFNGRRSGMGHGGMGHGGRHEHADDDHADDGVSIESGATGGSDFSNLLNSDA
ncbi:MAG: hypothetical protein ACO3HT_08185 [Ilumatobacteraceae bacterium]